LLYCRRVPPHRLDPENPAALLDYLIGRGLIAPGETLVSVSPAGAGNMNCTLRIVTAERRMIVKQGRPWVEKYPHIPAPAERTLVEAAFYSCVAREHAVSSRMPSLLHADEESRILVLEDVDGTDFTSYYDRRSVIDETALDALLVYLQALHRVRVTGPARAILANREMRALNHEHMFRLPLAESNGLDLERFTPGLRHVADTLKRDAAFTARVSALGEHYLADGSTLVHGDFFPGSWLNSVRGPVVIDPEFCFLGDPAFDYGVMLAHMVFAAQPRERIDQVTGSLADGDAALARQFAGCEIARRLIGVAQLPLQASLAQKQAWLEQAHAMVLA
jgi:5-methylthioribose kinase